MVWKAFEDLLKSFLSEDLFQNHCVIYRLDKTSKCLLSSAYGNRTDKCIVSYFHPRNFGFGYELFFLLFLKSKEVKKWVCNFLA